MRIFKSKVFSKWVAAKEVLTDEALRAAFVEVGRALIEVNNDE